MNQERRSGYIEDSVIRTKNHSAKDKEKPSRINSISVVIPALNEEFYLPNLLESLTQQKGFNGSLQVIVVDGNSSDNTVEVAKSYEDRLNLEIVQTGRCVGHQRNVGAQLAKYDHLLFLDSDVILPPNTLNKLIFSVDPKERIVDNTILLPYPKKFLDTAVALVGNATLAIINKVEPAMIGPFIFTTKDNHIRIGGFKEGAIIGEDLDYAIRSVKDGAINHMHTNFYILNSSRRADKMGRLKFVRAWAEAYFHVRKHGPIYDNFKYPFGDYYEKFQIR